MAGWKAWNPTAIGALVGRTQLDPELQGTLTVLSALAKLGIVWIVVVRTGALGAKQKILTVAEGEAYSHQPIKAYFRSLRFGTSDGDEVLRSTVVDKTAVGAALKRTRTLADVNGGRSTTLLRK